MRFFVTQLRQNGRRLRRSELKPPIEGELTLQDWPPQKDGGRWRLKAELTGVYGQTRPSLILPIFDVQVMRIDSHAMFLQGTEIEPQSTSDGGMLITEHVQVWLCEMARSDPENGAEGGNRGGQTGPTPEDQPGQG